MITANNPAIRYAVEKVRTRTSRPINTKEHCIQNLVDQAPEEVEIIDRRGRHGEAPPVIADQEPGHDHGDRSGEVQGISQGVSARDQSQGQQNLDLVVVDGLDQPVNHEPDHQAEDRPADRFLHKENCQVARIKGELARGNLEEPGEDRNADAVVEERLAGDLNLERPGSSDLLEQRQYRDRIGRRDESTEQQAVDRTKVDAAETRMQPTSAPPR